MDRAKLDSVKPLAKRLGVALSAKEGTSALLLFDALRATFVSGTQVPAVDPSPLVDRVGIWRREDTAPERYLRDPARQGEWDLWAAVDGFPARKRAGAQRVVFIGESVARGVFYAPHFTPAAALSHLLQGSGSDFEVIDLTRIDLLLPDLHRLLDEAVALEPDAVVVFAGNNWSLDPGQLSDTFFAEVLDAGHGLRDVFALCDELLAGQVAALCDALGALRARCRVVYLIPEFNLRDWSCAATRPIAPWLEGSANAEWMELRDELTRAEQASDDVLVQRLGEQMLALDAGTSPVAPEALGRLFARQGDLAHARTQLEHARDAMSQRSELWPPRCRGVAQAALRAHLPAAGIDVVDVPQLLAAADPALPGHQFFLDYCHHTSEGIALVMRAAARALLQHDVTVPSLAPTLEQEATAWVLAAIHNAHWGQPATVLRALCVRAAETHPCARELMRDYVVARGGTVAAELSPAHEALRSASEQTRMHLPALPAGSELMDAELVAAMAACLPAHTHVWQRTLENSGAGQPVNLLQAWHHLRSYGDMGDDVAFFRAFDVSSVFRFVLAAPCDLELKVVARLPAGPKPMDVVVELDGARVCAAPIGGTWSRARFVLARARVQAGVNTLTLRWPNAPPDGAQFLASFRAQLEIGQRLPLFPVFGELAALELIRV